MPGYNPELPQLSPVDENLNQAIKANPTLGQDPQTAAALVGNNVPGHVLGQATKFMQMHNVIKSSVQDAANSSKAGSGFWGAVSGIGEGLFSGAKDLVRGTANMVNRAATTVVEAGTLGAVGDKGLFNFSGNLHDAYNTMNNIDQYLPTSWHGVKNDWNMMAHTAAFYESLARRRGWGYALGYGTPNVVAGILTDGALTGVSGAEDLATIARIESSVEKGTATSADMGSYASALSRVRRANTADTAAADASVSEANRLAANSSLFKKTQGFFEGGSRWSVGLGARTLRGAGNAAGNLKLNAMYGATAVSALGDPQLSQLWKETADLHSRDSLGRKLTVGQYLADVIGAHGALGTGVSGITDAYTHYLGSDPFQAVGAVTKASRSAQGLGGILGRWWGGLGVETGDDVYRTASASTQAVRSYEYMATHSAEDIGKRFPGMYPEPILRALGETKDVGGVLDIHAALADGVGLTRHVAPTMGIFKLLRSKVRDGLTVGQVMSEPVAQMEQFAHEVLVKTGYDIRPNSPLEAITNDPVMRGKATIRRWLARNFDDSAKYIDEAAARGQKPVWVGASGTFRPGDTNSIIAIAQAFRATGQVPEWSVKMLEDALHHTNSGDDFAHVVLNFTKMSMTGAIAKSVSNETFALAEDSLNKALGNEIGKLWRVGGGGKGDVFVNGRLGVNMSNLVNPADNTQEGIFGIGFSHLDRWTLMDPRDLKNLVRKLTKTIINQSADFQGAATKLRALDDQSIAQAAEYKGARLEGLRAEASAHSEVRAGEISTSNNVMGSAYRLVHTEIADTVRSIENDTSLTMPQRFLKTVKYLSDNAVALEHQVNAWEQDRLVNGTLGKVPNDISVLYGRLEAFQKYESHIYARIQTPAVTIETQRQWVEQYVANVTKKESTQREMTQYIMKGIIKARRDNGSYLNRANVIVDVLNRLQRLTLIPLALSAGGYMERIAGSEGLLNVARMGTENFVTSRIVASIAQHELRGVALQGAMVDGVHVTEQALIQRLVKENAAIVWNYAHTETSAVRDMWGGMLSGIEKGLVTGMDKPRYFRMLGDFTGAIMRHNGHLPDIGHNSAQLYDPQIMAGAARTRTYGFDENGVASSRTFRNSKFKTINTGENIATAWREQALRAHSDPVMLGSAQALKGILEKQGYANVSTAKDFNKLWEELAAKDYERLSTMSASARARFRTSDWIINDPQLTTGDPMLDWSKRLSYNTLSLVHGVSKGSRYVFHQDLLDQIVSGAVKDDVSIAHDFVRMDKGGGVAPSYIIGREFSRHHWAENLTNPFTTLNHLVLDNTFARALTWGSRTPTFLWENHLVMEDLRQGVADKNFSQFDAELMADNSAFRTMSRFVHNPVDRFHFEANTRLYAPFYFAKNQAFRRAFRVMETDPGAVDRYLRSSLAITHWLSVNTQNGNRPEIPVPGSEYFAGALSWAGISVDQLFHGNNTMAKYFSNLGIGYSGNPSSVQTVAPTGNQEGTAMFEEMIRPPFGAFASIPLKLLNMVRPFDTAAYTHMMKAVLGPIGGQTGIMSDLFPSTFYRAIGTLGQDVSEMMTGSGQQAAITSVEKIALHSAFNNMRTSYIEEYLATVAPHTTYAGTSWESPTTQMITDASAYADRQMSLKLRDNSGTLQALVDFAHVSAQGMYLGKAIVGFTAPVAAAVKDYFSKSAEFQKILAEPGMTLSAAFEKFATEYPGNFLDLTSRNVSPHGSFPEDVSFLNWATKNPDSLKQAPELFAYLIDRSTKYDGRDYTTMVSLGLKRAGTVQEYTDAVLGSMGDDFYYNHLLPTFYQEYGQYYGPQNPNNTISYNGRQLLASAAQHFGTTVNPTWYDSYGPQSVARRSREATVMEQYGKIFGGPTDAGDPKLINQLISEKLLTLGDVMNLKTLYGRYTYWLDQIHSATSQTERSNYENQLWTEMQTYAQNPQYKNQQYIIQHVLATSPTR